MSFYFKKTAIYKAVKLDRNLFFRTRHFFEVLFGWLMLGFLVLTVASFFVQSLGRFSEKFFGASILSFAFWIFFWEVCAFFDREIKNPKSPQLIEFLNNPQKVNVGCFLDFKAAKVCYEALKIIDKKSNQISGSLALIEAIFSSKLKEISFLCERLNLSPHDISEYLHNVGQNFGQLKSESKAPAIDEILEYAASIAQKRKRERIGVADILLSLADRSKVFQKILVELDIQKNDITELTEWFERLTKTIRKMKRFWDYNNLLQKGALARDWASGYTVHLDDYSRDLREEVQANRYKEFFGHQKDVSEIERILEKRTVNNVLLVGAPGSGKMSVIEALAQKSFLGRSLPSVNHQRFLDFDIGALIAAAASTEEMENLLDICFREAVTAGNVILVVRELQEFLGEQLGAGRMNIGAILGRYLPLPNFRMIGVVNYEGLHKIVERDPAINNLFEKVEISEISPEDTVRILESYVPFYEKREGKFITFRALKKIVELCAKYMPNLSFPEKAVRVLDEVVVSAARKSKQVIESGDVAEVISEKIKIPVGEVEKGEREKLLHLESLIHRRIINQEEAVKEVSTALRRARSGVQQRKGTIGNFLFLGPTGVGKTETSKALAQIYFRNEEKMVRLDMSEFQSINDIPRLIGSESQEGLLTAPVKENPFSLVLLDEIEKAHPNILNLFLQVLDEGHLTDGLGRKISFKNTIIIATSNAGAEIIREDIEKNQKLDMVKKDLLDYLLKQRVFRPEFINRFDAVVVFKPLTKENLLDISQLMLTKIKKSLQEKGIEFVITEELKQAIVHLSYSPAFGAREMRRVLQDKVENAFAKAILSSTIKRGDKVKVDPQNFSVVKI